MSIKRRAFLKSSLAGLTIPGMSIAGLSARAARSQSNRPNILFILSDDQNWDEISVPMAPSIQGATNGIMQTPNLERLATQGMRFSQAYAPAPVCSPTRASILTGKSPAALNWTKAGGFGRAGQYPLDTPRHDTSLSTSHTSFADLLSLQGYRTAHFGKWHLKGGGPESHGFQVSDGDTDNATPRSIRDPNPVDLFGMAQRAESFMAGGDGAPFFLQLSLYALHIPKNALQATKRKYQQYFSGQANRRYLNRAALAENMDTAVGMLMSALDRLGLAHNTYVIFMSDNGGITQGRPPSVLRGGKGNLYEGGIRVPLIVRGPGIQANSLSPSPVHGFDLMPTFLDWAGNRSAMPRGTEGASLTGLLSGQAASVQRPRQGLAFHFPHYQDGSKPMSALVMGDYKLIYHYESQSVELFNLSKDLSETQNIAATDPERTKALFAILRDTLIDQGAQFPS